MAADFVEGLCAVLEDGVPSVYSGYPLARASLEASATAWWLADTDIGTKMRVARFVNLQYESFRQQAKLSFLMNGAEGVGLEGKMARLVRAAEAEGMLVTRNRSGKRVVAVGENRPPTTELVGRLLEPYYDDVNVGKDLYRFYCAPVHSSLYGILSHVQSGSGDGKTVLVQQTLDARAVYGMLIFVSEGFQSALSRLVVFYGWDRSIFEGWEGHLKNVRVLSARVMMKHIGEGTGE